MGLPTRWSPSTTLTPEQLEELADEAAKLTGDPTAIRAIRQIRIGGA